MARGCLLVRLASTSCLILDLLLSVGEEFFDTITIGGSLTIPNQSIGTAEVTLGNFAGFDGIMGRVLTYASRFPVAYDCLIALGRWTLPTV